ncbi:CHASE2 domain-containing protein [Thermosynechococcaceae cyanobacterium BACA0444]|uniref:non-specific serine/threonine protein kinase n=1 Tax=Pseudocalidococcus azoricus BACA0444 TaxID=2918990 RepID=A0AAE4JZ11_9CYAN|nr:CHASE2 domain-containing protein [Pseudocalidococcus azoricus]MDS3860337.1 CHASE2 domain-containing protein [Pseudocalidococcus azoricus BACA0444]
MAIFYSFPMSNAPLWRHVLQSQLPAVLIAFGATLGVMGLKMLTLLESFELRAYDQMMRSEPERVVDSPILLVTITEADIQSQKIWPLPDWLLIQALEKLQAGNPKVIGLDLFRDLPIPDPFNPEVENTVQNNLSQYLIAHPDVLALCKVGRQDNPGVASPAGLESDQVGFADLPLDPDGVVRRGILVRTPTPEALCTTATSLGFLLAQRYLSKPAEFDANEQLKIGDQVFERIMPNTGGYQGIDARGYQILIDFQKDESLGQQVSLTQVLKGEVPPAQIRNRVVLLGVTADSSNDKFITPLNNLREGEERTPGLVIHAQIVQQIIGAVNRTQPLIWAWDGVGEWVWGYGWSLLSGVLWLNLSRRYSWLWASLGVGIGVGALVGVSYGVFVVAAGWLPLIPAGLGMVTTSLAMVIYGATRLEKGQSPSATLTPAVLTPDPVSLPPSQPQTFLTTALDLTALSPAASANLPGRGQESTAIFNQDPAPLQQRYPQNPARSSPKPTDPADTLIELTDIPDETSQDATDPEKTFAVDGPSITRFAKAVPNPRPGQCSEATFVLDSEPGSTGDGSLPSPPDSAAPPAVLNPNHAANLPSIPTSPQVFPGEATVVDADFDAAPETEAPITDISALNPHNLGLKSTDHDPTTSSIPTSSPGKDIDAHSYSAELIPGLLAGRYQIITQLGRGGFGRTYLAEDTQMPLKPVCVVKQLLPSRSDAKFMQVARRLFQREAATLAQVGQHDRIPRLLAYFEESQAFFLVQEYVKGRSLQDELQQQRIFSPGYVRKLLEEILTILVYVHSLNVIHRDIKPGNILRRDSDQQLVLIDFGAVRHIQPEDMAAIDQKFTIAIGTRGYAPSEQMAGYPTFASDIYALGAVAIQALSGVSPSNIQHDRNSGELIWASATPISDQFEHILNRMVRYNFRQRYQSAQAVLDDLAKTSVH